MFRRAVQTGEVEALAGVVLTLIADLLGRSCRFDEAQIVASGAKRALAELEGDEEFAITADVARYIRTLAAAGDDDAHCCGDAFAVDE